MVGQLQPDEIPVSLMVAVIQSQDADGAVQSLNQKDISVARLPSVGAFLGRRNVTLLIGVAKHREHEVMQALNENCRQRIEFIAVPLESAPLPLPAPTPVTVGGATVFTLDVEYYEEY